MSLSLSKIKINNHLKHYNYKREKNIFYLHMINVFVLVDNDKLDLPRNVPLATKQIDTKYI